MLILPSKDGLEWGPPRNVTASIKASDKIRVMFGMVNGIELRSGPHPHRIVLPGWALLNRVGATGHYDVSGTALMCKHPQRSPLVLAKLVALSWQVVGAQTRTASETAGRSARC